MSTTDIELNANKISHKQINLFVRDSSDLSILKCVEIDISEKDFCCVLNIYDVECLQEISEENLSIENIQLEETCLSKIVAKYAKRYNRGIINLMFDYSSMPFKQMQTLLPNIPITLVAMLIQIRIWEVLVLIYHYF